MAITAVEDAPSKGCLGARRERGYAGDLNETTVGALRRPDWLRARAVAIKFPEMAIGPLYSVAPGAAVPPWARGSVPSVV